MRFSREFIDKVVSASHLADIVSQFTVLKPSGRDLVGKCPFPDHKEKSPSFHVSPDKQVYHCFGCKKGGNVFTFLQHFQGMSFPEAVEFLALKAHIPLPKNETLDTTIEQTDAQRRALFLEINKAAAQYFCDTYKNLPTHHEVREYTHRRYLKTETIEEFQIGYASGDWEGLTQYLRTQRLSLELAEELGLVKRRDSGGYFDLFRNRLMFVINNPLGNIIGFGGRLIGEGQPKYLNSPESPLFHKGRSLYGLNLSSRYIRSQDSVIVVEGYMDLISLYQAGFRNIVAPLGTALTPDQCRILARLTKNVTILFDGDSAGQLASERSLPLLLDAGLYPKGLTLEGGKDPDEFLLTEGSTKLAPLLEGALDLFSIILRRWMEGFQGTSTDKMRLLQRIVPIFQSIHVHSLKTLYIRETAQRLGVDQEWMRRAILEQSPQRDANLNVPTTNQPSFMKVDLNEDNGAFNQSNSSPSESEKIDLKGAPKWELLILAMALNSNKILWDQILQAEEQKLFTHKGVRQVFERALSLTGQSGLPSGNFFVLITNEIQNPDLLTALIRELPSGDSEGEARLLADCFRKVRIHDLDLRMKQLAQDLRQDATQEKWELLASLQKDRLRWINNNH